MQITEGHNGNTGPNQRVVCVVPLRSLGIHPNTRIRDEVGNFRQQADQNFLSKVYLVDPAVWIRHQPTISTRLFHPLIDDTIK